MRPTSRTARGAATAAVLAVTFAGPSAAQPVDGAPGGAGNGPVTGSEAAGKQPTAPVTVTLVTGDRILVSTAPAGGTAATAMPREDGSQPLVQTRQNGKHLYVYPESAVKALATGKADQELFNVTGLIRQGHDDAHTKKLPLIAVYDGSVNPARSAPPAADDGKGTEVAVLDTGTDLVGRQVTLKVELTHTNGAAVTQTVVRAYGIR
ncbi:hypothetical protein [Streptomyces sp. NBC_00045]|uniref:hypothetical protein n=1 Tax=Streptomyces sp. NBC_00045 TaxID=2975625 RepID=UPI00386FDE66